MVGYQLNATNFCEQCGNFMPGCLECSSMTLCTLCDTASDFLLTSPKCSCNIGFQLNISKMCDPICGDGRILIYEECDDGNVIPGDGCDGNCKI